MDQETTAFIDGDDMYEEFEEGLSGFLIDKGQCSSETIMQSTDEDDVMRAEKKLASVLPGDLCQELAESVLSRGPSNEVESEEESGNTLHIDESKTNKKQCLPTKFRFEDEEDVVEKSKQELAMEEYFAEAELAFAELPNSERRDSSATKQKEEWCPTGGSHEVMQDDSIGVYCVLCQHVLVESKDMFPPWAEKVEKQNVAFRERS